MTSFAFLEVFYFLIPITVCDFANFVAGSRPKRKCYQPTFIQAMLGNKSYQPSNLINTYLILKFLGAFESATALLDFAIFCMSSQSITQAKGEATI